MYICIKLSPRNATAAPSPNEVAGRNWSLTIAKSPSEGPWYPTVEERGDEAGYRFFAGRLTRRGRDAALPSGFTRVRGSAGDWRFDGGEPDGSWIALKFDRDNDELSIACDVWVQQRWFYAQRGDDWYFSNSMVFLRRIAGGGFGVEQRAIPYMLILGHLPGRITPLGGVSLLLPGEIVTVSRGQVRREQRTQLTVDRPITGERAGDISEQAWGEWGQGILGHLQQAVRDELQGVDSVVVPLSGGMDSRFMLGCALDVMPRDKIITYTFGDPRTMDQTMAKNLARTVGVEHVAVGMDRRPIDEVCQDGFEQTEGMAYVFPNFPLGPDRKAVLKPGGYVLSGFLGDCVFGSHDLNDVEPSHNTNDMLLQKIFARAAGPYLKEALGLLATDRWDDLGYQDLINATPGNTLKERYERWHYEIHCVNRIQYALFVFRGRAFYLTPFVQRQVWDYALSLPEAVRSKQRGYFLAMKLGYPVLNAQPTRRNLGFSAALKMRSLIRVKTAWYDAMNRVDDTVWRATGRSVYFDPRRLYASLRELRQTQYHPAVTDAVESLRRNPIFDRKGLDALLVRYRSRQPISTHLLRALITVNEWEKRYGGGPTAAAV